MKKLLPLHRFGWAFLLAWVFTVFYTQVVEGYTGAASNIINTFGLTSQLYFLSLPVLFSVLTLILIVRLEKRLGSPADHLQSFWIAPLLTAISCPFLFIQGASLEVTMLMFALGAICTGIGSGLMWVMWGEYYAKISQEDVEYLAPVSAAVAAVLVLLVSAMSGWVALAVVMSFPLISGVCLFLSWRQVQQQVATAEHSGEQEQRVFEDTHAYAVLHPWRALKVMGRAGMGIMIACLFVCLLGSFWLWVPGTDDAVLFQLVLVVSIVAMTVVSLISAKGPQRISVSFLFRWMCPLLVLGYVAIIIWGQGWGDYAAYMISIAARFSFCLITQMFFAHYVTSGNTSAVQAYGFGWIFVHLGDFLGVLCIVVCKEAIAAGLFAPHEIAAVSIAVLTVLTMFVLNRPQGYALQERANASGETTDIEGGSATTHQTAEPTQTTAGRASTMGADMLDNRVHTIARSYKLTPREVEVFELLARGRSVPFIRDSLVISRDTAATHVKHIYTKLDVHSRQELIDLVQGVATS